MIPPASSATAELAAAVGSLYLAMAEEEWRPVPGFPYYEASSEGRVRSIPRTITDSNGKQIRRRSVVLKTSPNVWGYLRTPLYKDLIEISRDVHTLVAEAFHGPRPVGMEVRHLNGIKTDNRAVNLRWGTHAENMQDQLAHGNNLHAAKTCCDRGHLLVPPNISPTIARVAGHRSCVACSRALSRARYWRSRGVAYDLQAISDECFRHVMGGLDGRTERHRNSRAGAAR